MFPEWLFTRLEEDRNFWKKSQAVPLSRFFSEYTLHDSTWCGILLEPSRQKTIAVFYWDTFWTHGRVPYDKKQKVPNPLLIIRFSQVYNFFFTDFKPNFPYTVTVAEASTNILTNEEKTFWSKLLGQFDDDIYHTIIEGIEGDKTHILHTLEVQIRCYSQNGNELIIPGI